MGSYSDELRMLRELTTRLDQTNSLLEAQNAILERILRSLSPANVTGSAGIRSTEAFGAGAPRFIVVEPQAAARR